MAEPLGTLHQIKKNNRWQLSNNSWLTILFTALLLGSIWFFVWQQINNDYDRTLAESCRETMNLAKAFEENIRSVISGADRDLLTLKQAYERDSSDTAFFDKYMAHMRQDPTRSIVFVLDEQGWIVVNSMQNIGPMNFSYRDYFRFQRDTDHEQLDIGKPILGALTKQNIIPLTRRINKPDGSFGGLVYIGMRADYFTEFYKKMELGQDKVITVTGLDGVVRACQEKDILENEQNTGQGELYRLTQSETHGTFVTPSAADEIKRVQSYRVMPDYPIVVAVGMSKEAAFAAFEKRKKTYIWGVVIVSLVIVSLCMLLIDRAEKALRESKGRYSSLIATMTNGFIYGKIIFENGRPQDFIYLEVNEAYEKMTGLRDVVGKKFTEVIPNIKESQPERFAIFGRASQVGQQERVEIYIKDLNIWLSVAVTSTHRGYFIAILDNITERKFMEEELNKHRDRLEILVEERSQELAMKNRKLTAILGSITDNIYVYDNQWNLIHMNIAAILSNSRLTLDHIGKNIWDIYPELIGGEMYQKFHDARVTNFPKQMIHKSLSEEKWFDCTIYPYDDGVLVYFKDITEKRKIEKEMLRLDRLNIVGEMAAGIGHEIRNPLTTVRGYLQLFQRKTEFVRYGEQLATMIEELDRANSIITEYISLAKDKAVELIPGNLGNILHALFPLLQADAFSRNCKLKMEVSDTCTIQIDEKEFRQLLLNLVRNAFEAMQPGGAVIIKTYCEKDTVVLAVMDTGPGIPEEILTKLGTPFITTKENGTGLGLAICCRIADRHNAEMEIKSTSEGTAVFVKFRCGECTGSIE